MLRSLVRQAKSAAIADRINRAENKSKVIWDVINENKSGLNKKPTVISVLNE